MTKKILKAVVTNVIFLILIFGGASSSFNYGQAPLKILVSNDDGIEAPGIAALCAALSRIGTVTVAAPTQNYSGASHSMTFSDPIFVTESERNGSKWFGIKATPATCVRLALGTLVETPDLVVTGINRGENLGKDTFYSATVGAAREAALKGIPAIAVSLANGPKMDYGPAAAFIADLVQNIKKIPFETIIFLNVNVPNLPKDQLKGVMVVPQDMRPALEAYEKRVNPSGRIYFWNIYKDLDAGEKKTDVWAVRNGYISITPFQTDQTNAAALKQLESLKLSGWEK
jgi:5'-nucleotidase